MNRTISTKELKKACAVSEARRLAALEKCLGPQDEVLSPDFEQRMRLLFKENENLIKKRRAFRLRLTAAMTVIVLLLAAFFGIDSPARAAVLRFIRETYETSFIYRFFDQSSEAKVPDCAPSWLPEGTVLISEEADDTSRLWVYMNTEASVFVLTCFIVNENTALFVDDLSAGGRETLSVQLSDRTTDCFISDIPGENSDYVWFSPDGSLCYTINSTFPHEINLKLIESIPLIY